MLIRELGRHSTPRCAIQEPNLDQKWLIDLFDCVRLFRKYRRQSVHAHRTALIFLNYGQEQLAVDLIKPVAIDFQHLQRSLRSRKIDLARAAYLCIIANPP